MDLFLAGIHQHSIPIDVALVIQRFIWLAAIIKGDGIGPDILPAFTDLLSIVLPVDAVPIKVDLDSMFEAGPDGRAWIRCGSVDHNRAGCWSTAVVDPILPTTRTLFLCSLNVVTLRSRIPYIDVTIEFLHIMLCDENRQRFSCSRVRVNIVCKLTNVG